MTTCIHFGVLIVENLPRQTLLSTTESKEVQTYESRLRYLILHFGICSSDLSLFHFHVPLGTLERTKNIRSLSSFLKRSHMRGLRCVCMCKKENAE